MNIVVHNLKESSVTVGPARKQDDIKQCLSVFQTYLGPSVSINNAVRLGQRSEKPRQLKLSLSSTTDKAAIQKNKTKLRSSPNPPPSPPHIHSLFITPNLTPLEQKQHKALRQQLAGMNKSEGRALKLFRTDNAIPSPQLTVLLLIVIHRTLYWPWY